MTLPFSHSRPISLFDKYGGLRALRAVILDFYDRVLDSDLIGHHFERVDMARLVDHQTRFFAMLLGGPVDFAEDRLARVHAHLRISHADFDEVAAILSRALEAAGFDDADRDTILHAVEARRRLIVA
ncbi:MAG: group 1 truncated hemoglobin [Pseudooceanicola sp.]|nr:group 1 truncated hemoglobin [Pseudooceanicola sp.]